jgi:hypothetical protein
MGGVNACLATPYVDDLNDPQYAKAMACVEDGDQWNATLYTKPDFYCAMFEAKDDDAH